MKFHIDQFQVERIAKSGAWLVTCASPVDLGLLFLRPQEFYESGNPKFCGRAFSITEFISWYIDAKRDENKPSPNVFSYLEDFQGYNIPSASIDAYFKLTQPDLSAWDIRFARIASAVAVLQHGPFYLIGSPSAKLSVIEHEIAHAMFYLMPEYMDAMTELYQGLSSHAKEQIATALANEGYSERVLIDEAQAYMATGLLEALEDLEPLRLPFIKMFSRWKRKFIPPKRIKAVA